jgi:hypothetical protein
VGGRAAARPTAGTGGACCAVAGSLAPNHCKAVPASFTTDTVWSALDFEIDEETLFVYSYTGTATTYTATAVGDLDCDGTNITYSLTGTAVAGQPAYVLSEPPASAD